MSDKLSFLETRKITYSQLADSLQNAIDSQELVFTFNCPVFEEVEDYIFKHIGYKEEFRTIEDAESYLFNLKETISRLEYNESITSITEELGID